MTESRKNPLRGLRPRRLATAVLCMAVAATAQAQGPPSESACTALADWTGGSDDLQIDDATFYTDRRVSGPAGDDTLPPHCHVAGTFEHRTGVDGRDYAIGFAVNLPEDWNGRFLFQGGGGLNGVVREPIGEAASGDRTALARGFAVVSSDTGHKGSVFDGSFMIDQQAMLNFQLQANAKVVEVARPVVARYYGSPPHHSYFVGCSTGGREGMIMAQQFPHLFDGIVSGAPAMRTGVSNLALRWISNQLRQAEKTDPRDPFSEDEERLIMSALKNTCDARDGRQDGLIFNRSACDFDPADLACSTVPAGQPCLPDHKAEAFRRGMAGPVNAAGKPVYVPFPYDAGIDDTGRPPGLLLAGGSPPVGVNGADMEGQDVDAEYMAAMADGLGRTATAYNVSSFIANGGKHIFYHGEADPWFSSNDTLRYFEHMGEANTMVKPVGEYGRLYLVPGMGHCAGGERTLDRFDLLTPLVEWVESGEAPGAVTATGVSMPGESRPLCPWPTYAHFEGGDADDSDSYHCRTP